MTFKNQVKPKSNLEIMKELRANVKFENKDALLKEIREKRRERRY